MGAQSDFTKYTTMVIIVILMQFLANTGDLYIRNLADDKDVKFISDNGAGSIATYFYLDGSSATHDGSATTALYTNWPDKSRISLGTVMIYKLYTTATDSYIHNHVGDLYIKNTATTKILIFQSDDGSGGVETYFYLDGSANGTSPLTVFPDNSQLGFGSGPDAYVYHNGSDFYLDNYAGNFLYPTATL